MLPTHVSSHGQRRIRTIPDPEFPGEDEVLFFVMVEFNIDDIKELRRVTQIELTGTLDADGLRAFVDATCRDTACVKIEGCQKHIPLCKKLSYMV